ncbi:MAG: Rieske 2Fe-2S domain-containing protein [Firmicutes bacterium]|nr:Rieske 2Fe-2S domain-containing protein [Bacillota bacterium]
MCEGKEVENIFEPSRFYTLKNPIKAAKNTATILGSFANLLVSADSKKLRRLNNGQGAIVKFGCKRVGVYRDQKGEYYAVSGICTHMGCNLRWNKDEASWDCPCHGSRFTPKGDVINGPAIEEATVLTVEKTK